MRIKAHKGDEKPVMISSVPDAVAVLLQRYAHEFAPRDGEWVDIEGAELCPCERKLRSWVKEGSCWVCKACALSVCE